MTPTEERQAWRTYAAAALQGILGSTGCRIDDLRTIESGCRILATAMLAAEKERFEDD